MSISNDDLKKAQNRLLEMAKIIASILEKNNIPYQIAFGTLLGAVRHGGFIPWDDDFDFFLFDDSYEKAIEVLRKELTEDMFLEDEQSEPNYFHAWAHIKDMHTICECSHYPQDSLYSHHGLSVDLYRIKEIPFKDFAKFRYEQAIQYIDRRKQLGFITEDEYEMRKANYIERLSSEQDKIEHATESKRILAYPFDIGMQFYDDVFPLIQHKFENALFWGPKNASNILKMRYGNYQALPPEKDRIPHYSKIEFKE